MLSIVRASDECGQNCNFDGWTFTGIILRSIEELPRFIFQSSHLECCKAGMKRCKDFPWICPKSWGRARIWWRGEESGPEVKLMGFPPPHSYPAISGRSSGTAMSFRCWSKSEDNRHKHSVTGVGRPESQVDGEKPPPWGIRHQLSVSSLQAAPAPLFQIPHSKGGREALTLDVSRKARSYSPGAHSDSLCPSMPPPYQCQIVLADDWYRE